MKEGGYSLEWRVSMEARGDMQSDKTIRIFDGAIAIVTGGASGIGQALAEELAKRGCEVVLADLHRSNWHKRSSHKSMR